MSNTIWRKAALPLIALMVATVMIGSLWAGGTAEEVEEHHHDHEDDGHEHDHDHGPAPEGIPEIEPVSLAAGERLQVVATTSIVGDVVRQVAGEAAEATVLMAIGQNPHAYEPTPSAIATVEDAHIVFVNGLDLEEQLMDDIDHISTGYIVPVSAGIQPLDPLGAHDHEDDHGHGHAHAKGDPHVWFDPTNVMAWTENVAHALSEADPENHEVYEANAEAYIEELRAVDREIRRGVAAIPPEHRKLVVDHAALGYFAEEYGFEVIGAVIPSTTDQAEPSARDIAQLVELIKEEDVQAIFVGGTAGRGLRNLVDTVAEEVGRDLPVGELLTGSLAPPGQPGDTYLGFTRRNAEVIVGALSD